MAAECAAPIDPNERSGFAAGSYDRAGIDRQILRDRNCLEYPSVGGYPMSLLRIAFALMLFAFAFANAAAADGPYRTLADQFASEGEPEFAPPGYPAVIADPMPWDCCNGVWAGYCEERQQRGWCQRVHGSLKCRFACWKQRLFASPSCGYGCSTSSCRGCYRSSACGVELLADHELRHHQDRALPIEHFQPQ